MFLFSMRAQIGSECICTPAQTLGRKIIPIKWFITHSFVRADREIFLLNYLILNEKYLKKIAVTCVTLLMFLIHLYDGVEFWKKNNDLFRKDKITRPINTELWVNNYFISITFFTQRLIATANTFWISLRRYRK